MLDAIADNQYTEDVDNQSSADNCNYDKIGNIVSDIAGKITNIDWTVYGKIKRIAKQEFARGKNYSNEVVLSRRFKISRLLRSPASQTEMYEYEGEVLIPGIVTGASVEKVKKD